MGITKTFGLRTRIVLALSIVLCLFIALTEITISQLTSAALSKQSDETALASQPATSTAAAPQHLRIQNLRKMILFYLVLGSALALVMGSIAVSKLVVHPLVKVIDAVEQIRHGDLTTTVPVTGSGEIAGLASAFNRMTATLRQQRIDLDERMAELEKSAKDLKEAQEHLIRATKLASVGTLAAGVAHEIGNPLAGVLGLLEALDVEKDATKTQQYRSLMRSEIERMDRIISDLLAYARPARVEAGRVGTTHLRETINRVTSLLKAQKLFDRVAFQVDLDVETLVAEIPSDDLIQVLVNLSLNAAQAMNGTGFIRFRAARIHQWRAGFRVVARDAIRLTIDDNGPGIPKHIAARIFDPFFSERKDGQGIGLGLAICMSICERNGGEIRIDDTHTQGARFEITLLESDIYATG